MNFTKIIFISCGLLYMQHASAMYTSKRWHKKSLMDRMIEEQDEMIIEIGCWLATNKHVQLVQGCIAGKKMGDTLLKYIVQGCKSCCCISKHNKLQKGKDE